MNLYRRERVGRATSELTEMVGWMTDDKTRPKLISAMQAAIRSNAQEDTRCDGLQCNSYVLASECATMVRNGKGKDVAAPGAHDDHVMACAMALASMSGATYFRRAATEAARARGSREVEDIQDLMHHAKCPTRWIFTNEATPKTAQPPFRAERLETGSWRRNQQVKPSGARQRFNPNPPNFFAELKRRNGIRFGGLSLVGAWLLVQVAGTVLPTFDAREWLPRSIVILLAIGFVPALVFSWIFWAESTGESIKKSLT